MVVSLKKVGRAGLSDMPFESTLIRSERVSPETRERCVVVTGDSQVQDRAPCQSPATG